MARLVRTACGVEGFVTAIRSRSGVETGTYLIIGTRVAFKVGAALIESDVMDLKSAKEILAQLQDEPYELLPPLTNTNVIIGAAYAKASGR